MRHRSERLPPGLPGHLAAVLCLAALISPGLAHAAAAPKGVSVRDAWFETAPKQPVSGFFTIENVGQDAVLMTGFSSPACHNLMLQEAGVISHAASVKGMTVTAKGALSFARGGYHLDCSGASGPLAPGATVPVTISFNSGKTLTVPFKVRLPTR